jgi:hypothetical protein
MEWLIGSNIATFILAWLISRLTVRNQMLQENIQRARETESLWKELLNTLRRN